MQIETLRDVIQWTQHYHQQLAACLKHCEDKQKSERAKLLLDYLSDHEAKLSSMMPAFEAAADKKTLDTWCVEYSNKSQIKSHATCDQPYADMTTQEIIEDVEGHHQQIIDMYRYLAARAAIPSTIQLLQQLTSLEEHEAMRMMQGANRLEDI